MLAVCVNLRRYLTPALAAWAILYVGSSIALGQGTINPHWSKDGCATCHKGATKPIAGEAATELCLSCHDGTHASDEAHPVGRAMTASLADPGWPTFRGTVQCLTCHDAKQECDSKAERPDDNAAFLRQAADKNTPFCANCHRPTQTSKFNPHLMLQPDRHTRIPQRCDVCHDKPMDAAANSRSGNASLRADQVVLCQSCHPRHTDITLNGHVQITIQPAMLAYMRARELTGLLTPPGPELIKQLVAQGARPTLMIPDAQGRAVCTTCHNPHEQGTFAAGSVLDDRSLRLMKGHLITPTRNPLFCRNCHNL